LNFDLLTLKVVSESRVTWAASVPILVFLGLSVLDLGPMYTTERRQTDIRRASSLNALALWGRGHNNVAVGQRKRDKGLDCWCCDFASDVIKTFSRPRSRPRP